jgi:hypothetical protein
VVCLSRCVSPSPTSVRPRVSSSLVASRCVKAHPRQQRLARLGQRHVVLQPIVVDIDLQRSPHAEHHLQVDTRLHSFIPLEHLQRIILAACTRRACVYVSPSTFNTNGKSSRSTSSNVLFETRSTSNAVKADADRMSTIHRLIGASVLMTLLILSLIFWRRKTIVDSYRKQQK